MGSNFELIMGLQQELHDADDLRYAHRIHCILLYLQGMSARKVAQFFGDSPRAVQFWVNRFEERGLSGLCDNEKSGAPSKLNAKQILEISSALRVSPDAVGMQAAIWDGKMLSTFIEAKYGINLSVRQCQRLFHQYGFRLRKPRPELQSADPQAQQTYKKTSFSRRGRRSRSVVHG